MINHEINDKNLGHFININLEVLEQGIILNNNSILKKNEIPNNLDFL